MKYKTILMMMSILIFSSCSQITPIQKVSKNKSQFNANTSIDFPHDDISKRAIVSSKILNKNYMINYHSLAKSGDKIGNGIFGEIQDIDANALRVSDANDFSSLHHVDGQNFMITHFETIPAAMYITKLQQTKDGRLLTTDTKNIDFSSVGGLWNPCAGSVTPWQTHLGSEEYEPDASLLYTTKPMLEYFKGDHSKINLYNYGWIPELKILNKNGDTKVQKHYAMGRFSHELAYVLPDNRTVYMSDDGSNVGLFMFIASEAKDLSSGKLYIAKYENEGKLQWIDLGYATNAEIKKAIEKGIKFNDIFDKQEPVNGACSKDFTSINTMFGHECLQLKDGMQTIASRLESRRYGAMLGGTSEFRKLEGITYNSNINELYLSISEINEGMLDKHLNDIGTNNDIKFIQNDCGAIYRLKLYDDKKIDSKYVAYKMSPLIKGEPLKSKENTCNPNSIANPDNITYIQNIDTLIIGEDSTYGHQNDAILAYDLKKETLSRILTSPYGSETTSVYYYENFGGFNYIMAGIQHPYAESDEDKVKNDSDKRAHTGYFLLLPAEKIIK
jgi:uncharacterized protein